MLVVWALSVVVPEAAQLDEDLQIRNDNPAYRFVGLLDGRRTVAEAWDLAGGQLADDAPTQPEVIQILSHLYSANLIDADVTPDATVLLRRHKQQKKRKMQGRLMQALLEAEIEDQRFKRLLDPDPEFDGQSVANIRSGEAVWQDVLTDLREQAV